MDNTKQHILQYTEQLYNAKFIKEYTIGNSGNLVFEVEKEAAPFILRASVYSDAKQAHVNLELNWVNYLTQNLNNIVKPIKSLNNNLYEIIGVDDKSYILCLFEKAKGKPVEINNPLDFNDKLFFNMGVLMGSMHKLTSEYEGNACASTAPYSGLLSNLPQSKDCYGIIHDDIHIHNFFVDNGQINLFDFDDCRLSWYAEDIMSAFFYMVFFAQIWQKPKKHIIEFAESYLQVYFKGYAQANNINRLCISKYNVFLRYRMEGVYSYLTNMYKQSPLNPHKDFLFWLKHRLVNDLPLIDVDVMKFV